MNYLRITDGDFELISAIAVGYPKEHPAARPRKKLEELLV